MVLFAAGLIIIGWFSAFLGLKLFKVLLPVAGFIAGLMVGFSGVQAVFGAGVVSISIAVIMALLVGVLMALLSFLFYEIAVIVLAISLGATLFTYLGVALGLENAGFILFLLGLTGGILGFILATLTPFSIDLVIIVTAFLGVTYILAGIMLLAGELSLTTLDEKGIVQSVVAVVDQSFFWLFAWIGGSVIAATSQTALLQKELFGDAYEYKKA